MKIKEKQSKNVKLIKQSPDIIMGYFGEEKGHLMMEIYVHHYDKKRKIEDLMQEYDLTEYKIYTYIKEIESFLDDIESHLIYADITPREYAILSPIVPMNKNLTNEWFSLSDSGIILFSIIAQIAYHTRYRKVPRLLIIEKVPSMKNKKEFTRILDELRNMNIEFGNDVTTQVFEEIRDDKGSIIFSISKDAIENGMWVAE